MSHPGHGLAENRDNYAEEISRLEHELSEASSNLKQFLFANSEYAENLAREVAEKEKAQQEAAEVEHQAVEMAAEVAQLKKLVGEGEGKISALDAEVTRLEAGN